MITDTLLTFANNVASGDTGTRVIGDVIDLKSMGDDANAPLNGNLGSQGDVGSGEPVYLSIFATEAYDFTSTTHTLSFALITSATSDLTDNVVIWQGATSDTDIVLAGTVIAMVPLPTAGTDYRRYLGLKETVNGITGTGKISAQLTLDPRKEKSYPQASVGF